MKQTIDLAVEALALGKTLLYPTDTIWGIGCDARNAAAVERLYRIKERDRSKSMLLLCTAEMVDPSLWPTADDDRPTTYVLLEAIWRRALRVEIAGNLAADDGSLGIRIPRHTFCREVMIRLGAPIVSTSANLSGQPSPASYDQISNELKQRVDYRVPPLAEFLSGETQGSRIVKVNADGSQTVIRP